MVCEVPGLKHKCYLLICDGDQWNPRRTSMAEVRRTQTQKEFLRYLKDPAQHLKWIPCQKIDPVLYKKIENDFLVGN